MSVGERTGERHGLGLGITLVPDHEVDGPHSSAVSGTGTRLQRVVQVFRRWLYMPDEGSLLVTLGTVAADRMPGPPVWAQLVGPPSSSKTEILQSVTGLSDVYPASTLTEASLLSGSPKRDRDRRATGGLLKTIGRFGIVVCKDFTSVLSMHHEKRQAVLAALREIYDGSWVRLLGTDGGLTLSWQGKLGLLCGCTEVIDRHHVVMNTMGERFLLFRMPTLDPEEQARRALMHKGNDDQMRRELKDAVTEFFRGLEIAKHTEDLSESDIHWLTDLSTLIVRARSATVRHAYGRDVELMPEPEAPARMVKVLAQLQAGLRVIGLDTSHTRRLIEKVAFDNLPKDRARLIDVLMEHGSLPVDLRDLENEVGRPHSTLRRHLEDLELYDVVGCHGGGQGKKAEYRLSEWARAKLQALGCAVEPPEGEST